MKVTRIKIKDTILKENKLYSEYIKKKLNSHNILSLNIMASPGAGKTSLISEIIKRLKSQDQIAVLEGDIVNIDIEKIKNLGVTTVKLINRGNACHLDSFMVYKALSTLNLKKIDILIIENVGNLICPANFDIGTHLNIVISSTPEGDDKAYKYPLIFKDADIIVLNKIDLLSYLEFDLEYFKKGIQRLNTKAKIFPLSCKTGDGIEPLLSLINKTKMQFISK